MPITRSTGIIRGPAAISFSSAIIYTKGDIQVKTSMQTFDIPSAAYGKVDVREKEIVTELTFEPVGMWTTAILAALFPHTNPIAGTSIFTAADKPVIVWPLTGAEQITYQAGAVTKMPSIKLKATETAFGSCTIACIGKDNTARTDAAKRFAIATASFTDTSFAVASIFTVPYTLALAGASSPWNSFKTKAGVEIDFNLQVPPFDVDEEGIVDMTLQGLDITVKFQPVGMTTAQILTQLGIQGAGAVRGRSMAAGAADLTIVGPAVGDPSVVINDVALVEAPQVYGAVNNRAGDLVWIATRPAGSGAMFALSTVSA
jgi:hypothetical protein